MICIYTYLDQFINWSQGATAENETEPDFGNDAQAQFIRTQSVLKAREEGKVPGDECFIVLIIMFSHYNDIFWW